MIPVSVIVIIIVIVVIVLAIIMFIAICKQNKSKDRVRSEETLKPSMHRMRRNSHIAGLSFAHHRHSTQLSESPLEQIKDVPHGENETDNGGHPSDIFVVQNTGSGQGTSHAHGSGSSSSPPPAVSRPRGASGRPVAILKSNADHDNIEFPEALPAIARNTRTENAIPDYKPAPLPPISSVSAQLNPDNLRGDDIP